jgi:hypothetical protein
MMSKENTFQRVGSAFMDTISREIPARSHMRLEERMNQERDSDAG